MSWSTNCCAEPTWQVAHLALRFIRSRVSYIPSSTDVKCGQLAVVCGPSQPEAGPWQFSQLTPSSMPKVWARFSLGTSREWQIRHFWAWSGRPIFKILPMRSETGLESTLKALACLSCPAQMVYSFWKMRVTVLGWTLPWQLLAAQLPAPLYLPMAAGAEACANKTGVSDGARAGAITASAISSRLQLLGIASTNKGTARHTRTVRSGLPLLLLLPIEINENPKRRFACGQVQPFAIRFANSGAVE